jgi:hypothetical protein
MWAPCFALSTVETHLRLMAPLAYIGDMDKGKIFHNFVMQMNLHMVAGMDFTSLFPEKLLK